MFYLISFLMIIIEVSLPFSANMYAITLPFLTYLVNLKKEKGISLVIVIALIHSLQTDKFFEITVILLIAYYIFHCLFTHLTYGRANIVLITLLQSIIYIVLSIKNLKKEYFIANVCIFIILNYIYMKNSKKKENIKG